MFAFRRGAVHGIILLALILSSLTLGPVILQAQAEAQTVTNGFAIPRTQATPPAIDGSCSDYVGITPYTFVDGGGATGKVYLLHEGAHLYVCVEAAAAPYSESFTSVYLDPEADGAGYEFANKSDFALRINAADGSRMSHHGNGTIGGWVVDPTLDPLWEADVVKGETLETSEYRISLGRFRLGDCGKLFALGAYHHWFTESGDDYGFPSNQWYDQPRTWQYFSLLDAPCQFQSEGKIAYVYYGNTADASSFYNLLTGANYTVSLVPLAAVLGTDFSQFDLILIADDTGFLSEWGSAGLTAEQVDQITAANKPIIGIGEGGYAFFGRLAILVGWPHGWHSPQTTVDKAPTAPPPYFTGVPADPIRLYSTPVNSVGIYLGGVVLPPNAFAIAMEDTDAEHANLIQQGCRLLWGSGGNPLQMTADGKQVFLNAVAYMHVFQCSPPVEPPPVECISVTKTADPPSGTTIGLDDEIRYTLTYTYSDDPACENPESAWLLDLIPQDSLLVPWTTSGGVTPSPDGMLRWPITPMAEPQSETFVVRASEAQCHNQRQINNWAAIMVDGEVVNVSDMVYHPVECPPITLPNDQPMFAEEEITIYPYPMQLGHPSDIHMRVSNYGDTDQTVTVEFQTSPDKFGIGLGFTTFASDTIVIPAHGNAIAHAVFIPASSGHYCIQIKITGPGLKTPILTQRNIDVTEDLKPGVPDKLTFAVGNPTAQATDVHLVIDNTCPGWTVTFVDPVDGTLKLMNPGEVRQATVEVTPPDPVVLGSGCHIDIQGWADVEGKLSLIGGIRKLDVPPVNLPVDVNPPWAEPEITMETEPPVVDQPNKICIELANPLGVARTVTVEFAVAGFGANPFQTIGTKAFTLPPNSLNKYCIDWTPDSGGGLYRCLIVTLKQPNYEDMRSQRNVQLVKAEGNDLSLIQVPFAVTNPDLVQHTLTFSITMFGIDPVWHPVILPFPPDGPLPNEIKPGQQLHFTLGFDQPGLAPLAPYAFGDVSQVEVAVMLDGKLVNGFTVEIATPVDQGEKLFLPAILR